MFLKLSGKTFFLSNQNNLLQQVKSLLFSLNVSFDNYRFYSQGKIIKSFDHIQRDSCIQALIPLVGGKGGYGAKLKTEGGKKVRPNDNMFSRDVSGQRLVYSTMEKQYKQFVVKKFQEDQRVAKEREQFKVMENTLREGHSFMKLDKVYKKEVQQTERKLIESIQIGKQRYLQKVTRQNQVKANEAATAQKKGESDRQSEQEKRQGENSLKRQKPLDEQQNYQKNLEKKIKVDTEIIAPVTQKKAAFSSAQQRFKALFKK